MAQHDYIISNATFPATRTDINNALSAIQTTNSGTSRPTGAVAGQLWLDTTSATTPTLKYYDGADDISLATIDHTANTVNWLDSTVSITGLSTTATGTVLTLSDTATTSTVNLIIDNDKEIRFREATANGTNYVSLSAPTSLSADLTFTLPSADGTSGQALITNGSGVLSFASAGTSWQSVQTTGFTAVAGRGYPCNTTSSAFTVTLPASPSVGNTIQLVDYAGTFATNNLTLNPNGLKINSSTLNKVLNTAREGVTIVYVDSTQGWVATSGVNEGTQSLDPAPYSVDFLVIAGGGGGGSDSGNNIGAGGGGAGGYRNSYSTETSGGGGTSETELSFLPSTVYTVTVGGGGASRSGSPWSGGTGSNSSISGTGITTITSNGGGGGNGNIEPWASDGGSGGGNACKSGSGNGTANQGFAGANVSCRGNGGGGAGAVGNANGYDGGNGLASSITASSVSRGGGGGGGAKSPASSPAGSGGTGGGGAGGQNAGGTNGTANTGGGGGGAGGSSTSGAGGSGVVILRMPTASYSGTTTGSPTVTTSGADTIIVFNSSGTITG
jgi:hypothetical protein